jgi:cyclomaltodextrinase
MERINYLRIFNFKSFLSSIYFLLLFFTLSGVLHAQVDSIHGIPVEFTIQRTLQAGEAGVGLNGTFNNWGDYYNRHPYQLKNIGNNTWTITVPLLPDTTRNYTYNGPGFYEYKFVTYSISGKDTSITAWIPDPYNPVTDPKNNNNSILYVTDPVVYRLQPLNGLITKEKLPAISAKLATGSGNQLDVSSIKLMLDGSEVPNSSGYYDSSQNLFMYQVTSPLSLGVHNVILSVKNNKGFTGADTSTFTVSNLIVQAPYQFIFDPYSPNLKLLGDSVMTSSIQGSFNNYGADPMIGPDSDGLFTINEVLPINVKTEYQFIIKSASASTAYFYDPDNPHLNSDFNPYVIKQVNNIPVINPVSPHQGTILSYPSGSVNIQAIISPNDSNTVINNNSIKVYLDGNLITSTVDSTKDGILIQSAVNNISQGRHVVRFTGSDIHGNTATDTYLTFGVYPPNSGYHYVDAQYDDNGPGAYTYPSGTSQHSADIQEIDINSTADSLQFTVSLGAVDDYTRVAFEIINKLSGDYVNDLAGTGIKIPEWNNTGIYFIIAASNSSQLSGNENTIYISRDPLQKGDAIRINSDAKTKGQFKFSLSLLTLENILGSYAGKWYYSAYSYFANSSGTMKVGSKLGGSDLQGNPAVYDYAFFNNTFIQHRILSNYILPYFIGGPKVALVGTEYRGVAGITPDKISSTLANRPILSLQTDGGDWYEDTVRIYGKVSDQSIASATFTVKNGSKTSSISAVITGGVFSAILPLTDGINAITASVTKNSIESVSKNVLFNYHADHSTKIVIKYTINKNNITLDASSSTNPDGLPVSYKWETDPQNPASITLSGANTAIASYPSPATDGEYHFTLTAITSKDTTWKRAVVVVKSGIADTVNLQTWHSNWIDKAVVYEIYVRSFSFFSNFSGIISSLTRLKNLGITCIWLMPIMPAVSPHGYNITDYYSITPDYGTNQDFAALIKAAHQNGIKIVMDLVINHTSAVHPFMEDSYKYKSYSPYYNFYQWDAQGNYEYISNWWDLPNINYEEGWVRDYLLRMVKYWIEKFNIDGYRCDVAWAVNDTRPSGPAFWQSFRNTIKSIKPDALLLAEAQSDNLNYFNDKFDSGYDWPLYNTLNSVMSHSSKISSLDSLVSWYQGPSYLSYIRPFRFLENHDEVRFISVFSPDQTKLAASILLTLPGLPLIYAGQETGEATQRNMISWNDAYNLQPYYQKLILGRDANTALQQGSYINVPNTSSDSVYSFMRISGESRSLLINNFYGSEVNLNLKVPVDSLHLDAGKTWYANDLLNNTSQQVTPALLSNFSVDLSPYQSQVIIIGNSPYTAVKDQYQFPTSYKLLQNYPNPFNPTTTISYEIPYTGKVKLLIYDILGRKIATLVDKFQQPGIYKVVWNGKNGFGQSAASGIYFYQLQSENFINVKKMILLK